MSLSLIVELFGLRIMIPIISIFNVLLLISMKSIFAPQYKVQFTEATKEIGLVQTMSFFFNPRDKHDMCCTIEGNGSLV